MAESMKIDPENWDRVLAMPVGTAFKLGGGSVWTKMALSDLEWLHGKSLLPAQNRDGEPVPVSL
jgi:hypothetical protein